MTKVFKAVGVVASVLAVIPSPIQPIAAAVAVAASIASGLTAKKPTAKGSINEQIIGANAPLPYMMGRSYSGGVKVHDVGYGGTVDDVENPYRFMAMVYSCCGPVDGLESVQLDFASTSFSGTAASGYYSGYLWRDSQLGARPESDSLAPQESGAPDWGSTYKLSGMAAVGLSLKWDKKGKRFSGGQIPLFGAIWTGVAVYDPRLDSTYPGGSGAHRITDETTWEYSRNPALHALAYSYGRYVNSVKMFGVDLGSAAIDLAKIVSWANLCDTNNWYVDGTIYEPADKWNNLKRICETGAGEPVLAGGLLTFDYQAPRTSLATVTRDDLADGAVSASLGKGWKSRHNTLVARYRSESHQWSYVQSDPVTVAAWVTADGEEKIDERQFDLVVDKDHASQLALYDLYQRREAGPVSITCKPHMRGYEPGDCLTLDAELGVHPDGDLKVVIRRRTVDPSTGAVAFEFEQETDAKHTAALAATGTAPSTITLPTSEDFDSIYGANLNPSAYGTILVSQSYPTGITITGTDAGSDATVDVTSHTRVYQDQSVSVDSSSVTALDFSTTYWLYYDDADREGGAVTLAATETQVDAFASADNPARHFVGTITTPADAAGDTTGYPAYPVGWNFYYPI